MQINHLLDQINLVPLHTILTLFGVLISLYVMNLTSHYHEDRGDPAWLQWSHRGGLALLALTFLWMLTYGRGKDWSPWPPMVALEFIIDSMLVLRAITVHLARQHLLPRFHRYPPPNMQRAATNRK